uniref:20kDa lectin n=1 Tax=Sarcophaga peregrina TaxID=7386 RepID=O61262_SARPE|nr:20kDa lectin [Sarcophaga peregrina]
MKLISLFVVVAIIATQYASITGAPLTKWFKTDNNTYYIEPEAKFTWQQSYDECNNRHLRLITLKTYREDELLSQYLKQTYQPLPEFWLRANDNIDLSDINKLLGTMLAGNFLNLNVDGVNNAQVLQTNDPANCAITLDGTVNACETLHGFICHQNSTSGNSGQNVQNIVLKFN